MRRAIVYAHGKELILTEVAANDYHLSMMKIMMAKVSLTMPTTQKI
jgi:hypothetical protein